MIYDVIIIGYGPAGIAATIQLKKYNFNFLIFENDYINGSLINNANLITNYPGYELITGKELLYKMRNHLYKNDINIINKKIVQISYNEKCEVFNLKTSENNTYRSKFIIIASGTKEKKLNLKKVSYNFNSKISFYNYYYSINDIINHTNKKICIIGSGESAYDMSIFLSKKNKIFLILNKDTSSIPFCLTKNLDSNIKIVESKNSKYSFTKKENFYIYKFNSLIKYVINCDYAIIAIGRISNNIKFLKLKKKVFENLKKTYRIQFIGDITMINRSICKCVFEGINAATNIFKQK